VATGTGIGPTVAEQARSVVVTATTVRVTTDGGVVDLLGSHADPGDGGVLLAPGGSRLADEMAASVSAAGAAAYAAELPARLEFTDVVPVAARQRIRGRLEITGWLTPTEPAPVDRCPEPMLRLEPVEILLRTDEEDVEIEPEDFAAARPDPLAACEASILSHLQAEHTAEIALLTRLVPPATLHGVVRVLPLTLDRHGVVLRAERARDWTDLRLPFSAPVADLAGAQAAFRALVDAAATCPRRPLSFGPTTR
jgi:hypothetical protein